MVEVTVEQQILGEIRGLGKSVDKIERNQEMMSIKLLGGLDEDTKHGRLPIVETKVEDHGVRIELLERNLIRWKAYALAAAAIGGVMGSVASTILHGLLALMGKS